MVVVSVVIVVVSVSPLPPLGAPLLAKAEAARARSERDAFIVAVEQD